MPAFVIVIPFAGKVKQHNGYQPYNIYLPEMEAEAFRKLGFFASKIQFTQAVACCKKQNSCNGVQQVNMQHIIKQGHPSEDADHVHNFAF